LNMTGYSASWRNHGGCIALPKQPVPANALAVAGILLALIFAVLAAIPASRWIILAMAVVALIVLALLMRKTIRDQWDLRKENKERERFRGALKIASEEIEVDGICDVFGYEVMKSIRGLQNGKARLKPTQAGPTGEPYPLEVHITSDEKRYIVGYVSESHGSVIADDEGTGRMGLFMRRDKERPVLTRIWVDRVGRETNYPDWLDLELQLANQA
jgi:hypothetical protein